MKAISVTDRGQKQALLLHLVDQDAQDIFKMFTDTKDTYDKAITKFDEYFLPRKNDALERYLFQKCKQNPGESIDSYVTILKSLIKTCNLTANTQNDASRDQVIVQRYSSKLLKRFLQERDFTLEKLQDIARASEAVEQTAQLEDANVNLRKLNQDILLSERRETKISNEMINLKITLNVTDVVHEHIAKQCMSLQWIRNVTIIER